MPEAACSRSGDAHVTWGSLTEFGLNLHPTATSVVDLISIYYKVRVFIFSGDM